MHPVQKGWITAHWEVARKSDKEGFLDSRQRKQFTSLRSKATVQYQTTRAKYISGTWPPHHPITLKDNHPEIYITPLKRQGNLKKKNLKLQWTHLFSQQTLLISSSSPQVPAIFCLINSSEITFLEETCVEQCRQHNFAYMEVGGKKLIVKKSVKW